MQTEKKTFTKAEVDVVHIGMNDIITTSTQVFEGHQPSDPVQEDD